MNVSLKKSLLSVIVGAALFAATAMSANAAYVYEFETAGGGTVAIDAITGTESAADYYDYTAASGHPAFGTEMGAAFFWLYEETDTGLLSMNVIFNHADANATDGGGNAYFSMAGLPSSWQWNVIDDANSTNFNWGWMNIYTDGGSLGGFEDSTWEVDWLLTGMSGVDSWAFVSGDSNSKLAFDLAVGETLTVRATEANPVPEPATMLLFGTGLAAITGLRRRKK